ncbi:ATP-binding cassette sub- B member 6, mitochondrial [Podila clonocystis]|nr:ATP-binding cassette sub- B member 6, mitochondrial [Podila clonocystis]
MVTEWRTRFRRAMISFDNDARAKAVDSLLNFETVKYYSNGQFEEAIRKYMVADYKSQVNYQLLNLMQYARVACEMFAQNFIDMEKMIQLLDQKQSVQDSPRADRLIVTDGEVVFEKVNFQYDTPEGPPRHLVHGAQG